MFHENPNVVNRVDRVSTKHVEINEKILRRCLDLASKNWRISSDRSKRDLLLAAIRDFKNCEKLKMKPSYTVPPRPKPRISLTKQKASVCRTCSDDFSDGTQYFDAASSSEVHQTPKTPQNSQNRPETSQKSQTRPQTPQKSQTRPQTPRKSQTPQKSSHTSLWEPQTPNSVLPEQPSSRQDASGTPNAFLGISRLQQGTVPTSTPFKSGMTQQKPEMSFQFIVPSKHDQSQMRKIQCDHNLSAEDYERIVDIVESFTDVDNLSNSLIVVSKRNLSQIVPGTYELLRAI